MRKTLHSNTPAASKVAEKLATAKWPCLTFAAISLSLGLHPPATPHRAQRARESAVNVTSVSSRAAGGNSIVTLSADAPLTRAQTWQDEQGFHVVVYKGQSAVTNSAR